MYALPRDVSCIHQDSCYSPPASGSPPRIDADIIDQLLISRLELDPNMMSYVFPVGFYITLKAEALTEMTPKCCKSSRRCRPSKLSSNT